MPKRLRKMIYLLGGAGLALAIAAGVTFYIVGLTGTSSVERWIGHQIRSILAGYLNPQLQFEDLDYQYPNTAELSRCRLVAVDPSDPDQPYDIIAAERITIEFAERPRRGRPIVIQSIELDRPAIRLIAERADPAKFVGFSNLVRGEDDRPPGAEPVPLSQVLELRRIKIIDGLVLYAPQAPEALPMYVDRINTELAIDPDDATWHQISTKITRAPMFDLALSGRLNLDSLELDAHRLLLGLFISPDHQPHLPPQLSSLMRRYGVEGKLEILANGRFALNDPTASEAEIHLSGREMNFAPGEYQFPVASLSGLLTIGQGQLKINGFAADLLGGHVEASGVVELDEAMDGQLAIAVQGLRIESMLKPADGQAKPKYAGRLDADIAWRAPLAKALTEAAGTGVLSLTEGKTLNLPVVGGLSRMVAKANPIGGVEKGTDRAEVSFELRGDHAHLDPIYFTTPLLTMRGTGDVAFDGTLDLTLNGGPMEKVQDQLGVVGDVMGALTDALARYKVTGRIGQPEIAVEVGGKRKVKPEAETRTEPAPADGAAGAPTSAPASE